MPTKPPHRCTGCKKLTANSGSKCDDCKTDYHAAKNARRPSPAERGYTGKHRSEFRPAVMNKNPTCVCVESWCPHEGECGEPSIIADHHPHGRKELIAMGEDPDDPKWGRGLCRSCDSRQTARRQPGGWNQASGARA